MPTGLHAACIALGANLGDRAATLHAAAAEIAGLPETVISRISEYVETAPVSPIPQPPFLNAAIVIDTRLTPRALLENLLAIEVRHGRNRAREVRWGPRTLDLDLILYDDQVVHEEGLTIPHPRMHERRFVLEPLAQVAPDFVIPTLGVTVREQLNRLSR